MPADTPTDPGLAGLKEHAWREVAAINQALAEGRLSEAGWHEAMASLVGQALLASDNPFGQAGHSGDAASWEESRGFVARALDRSGTFLDVGCASGVMMESVQRWGSARGFAIEPFGLEIVPELAALARARLPRWAARIFVGNVRDWRPVEARFDYVLLRPEYAPPGRLCEMIAHVLASVCGPRGRLVVLAGTEEVGERAAEAAVERCGFRVSGRAEAPHPKDERVVRRLFWIDNEER